MKNIFWVTADYFLDVDLPIISEVAKCYKITWIVTSSLIKTNTYSEEYLYKYAEEKQIDLSIIQYKYPFKDLRNLPTSLKICLLAKKKSYKIYYFDDVGLAYLYFLIPLFIPLKRAVYAAHDVEPHSGIKHRWFYALYFQFVFRIFKHFHFFSSDQACLFGKKYSSKSSLITSLCLKDYGDTLCQNVNDHKVFLFFGAIRENKGLDVLIEAGNKLYQKYPGEFLIKIYGSCLNWNEYQDMIKANQAFDVKIGVVPNSNIPNLFVTTDFLVLPYLDVTQSGPLLISYNYGIPVIASKIGSFMEMITDGITGYLFERNNPDDLMKAMSRVIEMDRSEIQEIKIATKKKSQDFTPREISKKYIKFFDEFLGH